MKSKIPIKNKDSDKDSMTLFELHTPVGNLNIKG